MPSCSLENSLILIIKLSSRCSFALSTSATHIYLGAYCWHRCVFPSMGLRERRWRGLFKQGVTDLLLKETGPHTHTMPSPSVSGPLSPGLVLLKYPTPTPSHPSKGLCHCKSFCRLKQCQTSHTHTHNVSFSQGLIQKGPLLVRMHQTGLRRSRTLGGMEKWGERLMPLSSFG